MKMICYTFVLYRYVWLYYWLIQIFWVIPLCYKDILGLYGYIGLYHCVIQKCWVILLDYKEILAYMGILGYKEKWVVQIYWVIWRYWVIQGYWVIWDIGFDKLGVYITKQCKFLLNIFIV